jgi:hypothetical protein
MRLQLAEFQPFEPDQPVRQQFGDQVAFLIVVPYDDQEPLVFRNPNCTVSDQPGFPKRNVATLGEPTQITVIPSEASPGCVTCIINGRIGTCCS